MKKIQGVRLLSQIVFAIIIALGIFYKIPQATVIILGATLVLGPIFCGFICPFGFVQDMGAKLGIKQKKMPVLLHRILILLRYAIYGAVTYLAIDFIFTLLTYDPRANFFSLLNGTIPAVAAIVVMVVFVIISMFYKRPFCNYFCFEGAKYGLLSVLRPFRITRNEDSCVGCKKCDKVCPMHIEISKNNKVNSLQCVNCYECVSACPIKETLEVKPVIMGKKSNGFATFVSSLAVSGIVIVVILFAKNIETTKKAEVETPKVEQQVVVEQPVKEETEPVVVEETEPVKEEAEPVVVEETEPVKEEAKPVVVEEPEPVKEEAEPVVEEPVKEEAKPVVVEEPVKEEVKPVVVEEPEPVKEETQPVVVEDTTPAPTETVTLGQEDVNKINEVVTETVGQFQDGTYTGTAEGFRGPITTLVQVSSGKITSIEVTSTEDDRKWFERAMATIPNMVEQQTTDVDTVSSATFSSVGIINSCKNALGQSNYMSAGRGRRGRR